MRSLTALLFTTTVLLASATTATSAPFTVNAKKEKKSDSSPVTVPTYCGGGSALSLGDVTFRGAAADDCFGVVTDPQNDAVGGNEPWTVNAIVLGGLFDGLWTNSVKDDGTFGATNWLGIDWTLNAANGQQSAGWSLHLSDTGPDNLPVQTDMMVVLKAGTGWAAYLFELEKFYDDGLSYGGDFDIAFLNGGGQVPGLSHMTLYFRNGSAFDCSPLDPLCAEEPVCTGDCDGGGSVPEPATLILLGVGLLVGGRLVGRRPPTVSSL